MTSKKTILGVIGVLIIIAVIIALGVGLGDKEEETIKLGVSLPLTGEAASLATGMVASAKIAQDEINAAGGIDGKKLELVFEDDQCNSRGGINSLTKLATIDNVTGIIGPLCSAAAGPGLPVVEQSHIPIIIWASAPSLPIGKDYVFRAYPSDAFQGKASAEYVYNELGKRKVAIMYVQNDWGKGLNEVFSKRFKELGGEIVLSEGVQQDATDVRSAITKIKNSDAELVYFPAYPGVGIVGIKQMKEMGLTLPIIGGDAFETPEIIGLEHAEGVMYSVGKFNLPQDLNAKIKAKTGEDPNSFSALSYDAVYIFKDVIEKVGTDHEAIKNELKTYRTTTAKTLPIISFDSEGDLASAAYDFKIIENGKTRTIHSQ